MCILCASIPVVAAAGAKLNPDQPGQPSGKRSPLGRIAGMIAGVPAVSFLLDHLVRRQGQ